MFRNLNWFYLASTSLLSAGFLLSGMESFIPFIILIFTNFTAVFLVYRFNVCMDQKNSFQQNISHYFSFQLHRVFASQLFLVLAPLCIWLLESRTLSILAAGAAMSFLYSIQFRFGTIRFRLKNVFIIKSLFIGFVWASLILLGAGNHSDSFVNIVFIFVCIQVFIGAIIRDIPDVKSDLQEGVKSFPVIFGVNRAILILHLINIGTGVFFVTMNYDHQGVLFFGFTSLWRALNLVCISRYPLKSIWTQQLNLFTCVLMFLILLFLRGYEHF